MKFYTSNLENISKSDVYLQLRAGLWSLALTVISATFSSQNPALANSCKESKSNPESRPTFEVPNAVRPWPLWSASSGAIAKGRKVVVIVGPYSSGSLLGKVAKSGWVHDGPEDFVVAVEDKENVLPAAARPTEGFDLEIPWTAHRGDHLQLIGVVKSLGGEVVLVQPGYEYATRLAFETLQKGFPHLMPLADGWEPFQSKKVLGEKTRTLSRQVQRVFSSLERLQDWLIQFSNGFSNGGDKLPYPLMFKAVQGAASVGNQRVDTVKQGIAAFNSLIGLPLTKGIKNDEVHVSKFIEGPEVAVNIARFTDPKSGKTYHKVSSAILILKDFINGHPVYKREILLNFKDPNLQRNMRKVLGSQAPLIDRDKIFGYVKKWSDAVGFKNGPGHSEVMIDPNLSGGLEGPFIEGIDFALRLMGGRRVAWSRRASYLFKGNQLGDAEYGYAALRNPERFKQLPDYNEPWGIAGVVFLRTATGGKISAQAFEQLKALVKSGKIKSTLNVGVWPVGATVPITSNLGNIPGFIEFVLDPSRVEPSEDAFDRLIQEMDLVDALNWVN